MTKDPILEACKKITGHSDYNPSPEDPFLDAYRNSLPEDIRDSEDILCACYCTAIMEGKLDTAKVLGRIAIQIRDKFQKERRL